MGPLTSKRHSTLLRVAVCLLAGLSGGAALTGQELGTTLSASDRAKADLRDARSELETIAGERWLSAEAPPLPGPLGLGLSADEQAFDARLSHEEPGSWSASERRRLQAMLDRHGAALGGLTARGERIEPTAFLARAPELLRAAVLQSLQDRLALIHGDEPTCVAGLEARAGLAERLDLQPGVVGPLLAAAVQVEVLEDVHRLIERRATSRPTLERLEDLLLTWRSDLPGAATVAALEGLGILERWNRSERKRELGAEDAADLLFHVQVARDFVTLAHACRDRRCRGAATTFAERRKAHDPSRIPADFLMPNILYGIERVSTVSTLAHAARIAAGLRIEARELNGYPTDTSRLSAPLEAALSDLPGLTYDPHGPDGARLSLDLGATSERWPGPAGEVLPHLLVWDLPPIPRPAVRPPS